jgi:hypothetical protein
MVSDPDLAPLDCPWSNLADIAISIREQAC